MGRMGEPTHEIRWGRLAFCALLGASVCLLPAPEGLPAAGWRVFAVFTSVIAAFLLRPLEMAPTVLIGLVVLVATGTVGLDPMIKDGFGDSTVWLVVAAFLIADAVEATGLGKRIALLLLRALGRSMMGLAYAIAATELVLAPFVPSNTARGGGIVSPIVRALAESLGSKPGESPRVAGAYLHQVASHSNLVTSAMFVTAMAGNANIPPKAMGILGVEFEFGTWILGSSVPGILSLVALPLLLKLLERPGTIDVARVRGRVGSELEAMGPWKKAEARLGAVLVGVLLLWSLSAPFKSWSGIELKPTTVALGGVAIIVLLQIRSWQQLASCWHAWDALLWLGGFVSIAESLKATGFTDWFAGRVEQRLAGFGPLECTIALSLVYFASMFLFSQLTAHIAALAAAFFTVSRNVGAPPLLAVALISYFSCLCGCMTPWSSGPVIIHFQNGYVPAGRWMRNGFLIAGLHLAIWLSVGMAWWRWLGWW